MNKCLNVRNKGSFTDENLPVLNGIKIKAKANAHSTIWGIFSPSESITGGSGVTLYEYNDDYTTPKEEITNEHGYFRIETGAEGGVVIIKNKYAATQLNYAALSTLTESGKEMPSMIEIMKNAPNLNMINAQYHVSDEDILYIINNLPSSVNTLLLQQLERNNFDTISLLPLVEKASNLIDFTLFDAYLKLNYTDVETFLKAAVNLKNLKLRDLIYHVELDNVINQWQTDGKLGDVIIDIPAGGGALRWSEVQTGAITSAIKKKVTFYSGGHTITDVS